MKREDVIAMAAAAGFEEGWVEVCNVFPEIERLIELAKKSERGECIAVGESLLKIETTYGTTPAAGEADLSLSYTPVSAQPKADDEVTKELLADILLDMVTQHCHQEPSGAYDSGFIGVNADAMRALIELGKMRKVHDGGGRHVQASIGGIVIDNDLQT